MRPSVRIQDGNSNLLCFEEDVASSEMLKNALKDSDAIVGNGVNDDVQRGAALPP